MRRRRGHAVVVALSLALGVAAASCRVTEPAPRPLPDGPNILVIVTDDQRIDTLRVMPAVRRWFVREGTRFARAYATTPLCCPSRASLLTGRYAHNHGIYFNSYPAGFQHETAINYRLRRAGYATALVGKYFNGWPVDQNPVGFDTWALLTGEYEGAAANVDGRVVDVRSYSTTFERDAVLKTVEDFERDDRRPWFLYVAPTAPHPPFQPEVRYADEPVPAWKPSPAVREKNVADKPRFVPTLEGGRHMPSELTKKSASKAGRRVRALQLRTLMSVDDLVAATLRRLKRLGELDETLAVFTSDNGFLWGEHGALGKRLPYRESTMVPLLVRYPEVLAEGTVDRRLAANIDVAPTIADAAGLRVPEGTFDGVSLLDDQQRNYLYIEEVGNVRTGRQPWTGVVALRWKYVEYGRPQRGRRFLEYYRLDDDPFEMVNVLGDGRRDNDLSARRLLAIHALVHRLGSCAGDECR